MPPKNQAANARTRRRLVTLAWSAVVAGIVITLIYKEQVALLYVLATAAVTVLLVVVAMADLGGARRTTEPAPFDDAAAVADGVTAGGQRARRRA
ncbi:MAG: hypothetical protein LC746_17535 [Acidobacteria bacterium]|nr:hypothetical protein [Acidobacteriota bacterium]